MEKFIKKIRNDFKQWADRKYNLTFNNKNCVRLLFMTKDPYVYNNVIKNSNGITFRSIGKGWFVIS